MFAKKENKKPTHSKHIPMKNREEFALASAQQNMNNLTFNLELI